VHPSNIAPELADGFAAQTAGFAAPSEARVISGDRFQVHCPIREKIDSRHQLTPLRTGRDEVVGQMLDDLLRARWSRSDRALGDVRDYDDIVTMEFRSNGTGFRKKATGLLEEKGIEITPFPPDASHR